VLSSYSTTHKGGSCSIWVVGERAATPITLHISTNFVEQQNLTMRRGVRRFTRLTKGFSKEVDNHEGVITLHFIHYNFYRGS
jgi:hypothetical protein